MDNPTNRKPLENILSNGDIFNKQSMQKNQFAVGTKFLLNNYDYSMEQFRIVESSSDGGTEFRRLQSHISDVVMPLSSLQAECLKGNVKFLDAKGEVIKE